MIPLLSHRLLVDCIMSSQDIESIHVQNFLNCLRNVRQQIEERDGLKAQHKQQIREAFNLISDRDTYGDTTKRAKRTRYYQEFLKKVHTATTPGLVALCAVSFGKSRVADMREGVRLSLPLQIKKNREDLTCAILDVAVNELDGECFACNSIVANA